MEQSWPSLLGTRKAPRDIASLAFSLDGKLAAVASGYRDYILVWNTVTDHTIELPKNDLAEFKTDTHYHPKCVCFSPSGLYLAKACWDYVGRGILVTLWNLQTSNVHATLVHKSDGLSGHADFSPGDVYLVLGDISGDLHLWHVATARLQISLKHHQKANQRSRKRAITAIVFSPNGQFLAASSRDHTVTLWDVTTGQMKHVLEGHQDSVRTVVFSPNGQLLASESKDGTVRLWNTVTGNLHTVLSSKASDRKAITFLPDGQLLASATLDCPLVFSHAVTVPVKTVPIDHSRDVTAIAFSSDGERLAVASRDAAIRLWDAAGKLKSILWGHSASVVKLAFSPDGRRLLSGSEDDTVRLWDTAVNELEVESQPRNPTRSYAVTLSRSGELLALRFIDNHVELSYEARKLHMRLEHIKESGHGLAFSPDESSLAIGSYRHIDILDPVTRELQVRLKEKFDVLAIAFSPDGQCLATMTYDRLELELSLYDLTTLKPVLRTRTAGYCWGYAGLAFSPDGQRLVSVSCGNHFQLWKVPRSTARLRTSLRKVPGYTPGFKKLQTVSISGTVLYMKFLAASSWVLTDWGRVDFDSSHFENVVPVGLDGLVVHHRWIKYGGEPIVRLPPGVELTCFDAEGDRLIIVCEDGRILRFTIDRKLLHSTLEASRNRKEDMDIAGT